VTTQLRLVDTIESPAPPNGTTTSKAAPKTAGKTAGKAPGKAAGKAPVKGRIAPAGRASRRAVRWPGELKLDARTRKVGRAGVAAAREALERVAAEQERARSERAGRSQRAS
jgi:hypothetical protein